MISPAEQGLKKLPLTAIIMAGGKSRRLGGIEKPLIRVEGQRIIDRTFRIVSDCCREVLISCNNPQPYKSFSAMTIPDLYPDHGALGGLYSCLAQAACTNAFVVAGDMPFISTTAIRYLWSRHGGYDVVIPRGDDGRQPLHAIYSKNCLEPIKKQLDSGNLKISGFFPQVKVIEIPTEQQPSYFGPRYFFNLNTPADINQLSQLHS